MSESNNKVNGKLDFSNVKQSQLNSGQTLKGSFSELQSALRTFDTSVILKDAYTHFIQTLDSNNNPTQVTYWQASDPAKDKVTFVNDVNSNLAGKYIVLQEYLTKKDIVFYIRVDGVGSIPSFGDVQIPVDIMENDVAAVINLNFINAIKPYENFKVSRSGSFLDGIMEICYNQFGETAALDVTDTGFIVERIQEGESFKVGEVCIEYDDSQNPIYNGNLLKGMVYNTFEATFEVTSTGPTDTVNAGTTPHISNIDLAVVGNIYPINLENGLIKMLFQSRETATLQFSYDAAFTEYITVPKGASYTEEGLLLTNKTLYIRSSKATTLELLQWT